VRRSERKQILRRLRESLLRQASSKRIGIKQCRRGDSDRIPSGANLTDVKIAETQRAIAEGAEEIDMVINISALKDVISTT